MGGGGAVRTKAGHFTEHSSHNRIQELSGVGGQEEPTQETKPLASVFTMHVKQTTMT